MSQDPHIIGDWYREKNLGSGGFGIVTLWSNKRTEEKIAIKMYRGESGTKPSPKHKERWSKEVEMMQTINNANIVSYIRLPPNLEMELEKHYLTGLPMLSMEYCCQGDLRTVLGAAENCCGLPESDVRYILSDLMNAVSHLHELKITHRDLKPENIVLQLCDRPNKIIYKLIDLGYAKEIDAKSICASFVGTLQYLAPEFLYAKTYSCSVDYWSMGLVAFEVICGTRPFLPNMSPAQWLPHAEKKSNDIISIYQEPNENIINSSEIFIENHVSSCFKQEIEKWLRLALEFNPRKRGYTQNAEGGNVELAFFSTLKTALLKKILTIFCIYTYNFYSYEIDDFTCISTLQGWIERDTKIPKDEQLLLTADCNTFRNDELAIQYFDETYMRPMVYVFKKSKMLLDDDLVPVLPKLVKRMLEYPKQVLPYYFQKKSYAHSLYFIYKQNHLYNMALEASNIRIAYMAQLLETSRERFKIISTDMEHVMVKRKFSKEVLDFDFKQYLNNYSQEAKHWINSFDSVAEKIDTLSELTKRVMVRQESASRRIGSLINCAQNNYSKYSKHELNELLNNALDCFKKMRAKDKRAPPENCVNMVKILYNVLKDRDKLLRDIHFRQYLEMIENLDLELEKLIILLTGVTQHINGCNKELLNDHLTRQSKIWDFTIKNKSKSSGVSTPESNRSTESYKPQIPQHEPSTEMTNSVRKPDFILGNPSIPKADVGEPISLQAPLNFILGDPAKSSSLETVRNDNTPKITAKQNESVLTHNPNKTEQIKPKPRFHIGQPASHIINQNRNLRYELQEKNNESFMSIKTILNDPLDFSFLDE